MENNLIQPAVCRICRKSFTPSRPLQHATEKGPHPDTVKFVGGLAKHIMEKHPEAWTEYQARGIHFQGFLTLMAFETMDSALQAAAADFAFYLRLLAQPVPVTDAEIETAVANLGFTMDDEKRVPVIEALKNLRAYYTAPDPLMWRSATHGSSQPS